MAGTKADAQAFAARWAGRGDEAQDGRSFWIDLFQNVLGVGDALARLQFEVPVHTRGAQGHAGFIDVLIPSASALVEQKGAGVSLDKPELRQGAMVTPAEQGARYAEGLPLSQQPRYVLTCNFQTIRVYDRNVISKCNGAPQLELVLEDLPANVAALKFLVGAGSEPGAAQRAVSVEAGRIMGRIHDEVARLYHDPDSEATHHALSVLCTRLMFLMFCEDAGLIEPGLFHDYVAAVDAAHLRGALLELFRWLDLDEAARADEYPDELLARFPYMDGGLFAERIQIPQLSETVRHEILVSGCQEFDWSGVDPTVFGSIFEGALSHDARRAGGMHYTSPQNIHKVIDPLFLDALTAELDQILAEAVPARRRRRLHAFHERLGRVTVFDPACGSGNFLTESYLSLRRLEDRVLMALSERAQAELDFEEEGTGESPVKVSLANFHGIEINDYACCVARTALWIAEKQADLNTAKVVRRVRNELPLTDYDNIRYGNALALDWAGVCPSTDDVRVCGNPPFVGYSNLDATQKADRAAVFGKTGGTLDYVACWYKKAAEYTRGTHARCAFVSTNSICQGQQVEPLWRPLMEDGICIDFAWPTFVWDAQTDDVAHVHVVVVGFSREDVQPKLLCRAGTDDAPEERHEVAHVNAYLRAAPDAFVTRRAKPLCNAIPMDAGGKPTDGGNLLLSAKEKDELLRKEPAAEKWIRPFSMGAEFINGIPRWCLWLVGITPAELNALPQVKRRVEAVRAMRLTSKKAATRKKAETPWLFDEVREPKGAYVAVPKVSSGRRKYVPMGFVTNGMIPGDMLYSINGAGLYEFGVLMSRMHNAWMRTVAGRLKSDYRYANTVVYHNFPWPGATREALATPVAELVPCATRARIEACAQAVLDARAAYPGTTLAELYDPDDAWMYPQLTAAHEALDAAVEAAYGQAFAGDEDAMVAHLFNLYSDLTG